MKAPIAKESTANQRKKHSVERHIQCVTTLSLSSFVSNQIKSLIKFLFESDKSPYTQTHTRIHKTQYTIKEETMKL